MGVLLGKAARRWVWTLAAIGFITIVAVGKCVPAECLSRHEVRISNPNSHISYSGRVDGHKGSRCWYADVGFSPRADAQSRPPRHHSPSARLPGRTVGSIPTTGATAYAPHEVVLPLGLEQWINTTLGSQPIASFAYRFDAAYGQ